jgi:hypothetical protein
LPLQDTISEKPSSNSESEYGSGDEVPEGTSMNKSQLDQFPRTEVSIDNLIQYEESKDFSAEDIQDSCGEEKDFSKMIATPIVDQEKAFETTQIE